MTDCIFCKIVNKEEHASIIFEDDVTLAIVPIDPITAGHTLVIPKQHSVNLLDIDEDTLSHISVVAKRLSISLLENYDATAMNLLHAAGKDAQQSVFHFHFHIVPRYENDGLDLWFKNKL
jgi:histidine triad (HIT) family protein